MKPNIQIWFFTFFFLSFSDQKFFKSFFFKILIFNFTFWQNFANEQKRILNRSPHIITKQFVHLSMGFFE
jgi:hypothetical protein